MNLILCCGNTSLRERWCSALQSLFPVYQAVTLQDLGSLMQQKISLDLLFVHRTLVAAESIAYIHRRQPTCRLFILSDRPDESEGLDFIRLGAIGYANSYISAERLQEAARTVASGSVWINQQLMQRLIAQATPIKSEHQPPAGNEGEQRQTLACLSDREYQIAGLVAEGLSNMEIAGQLGITERTVKAHLGAIYSKTSTRGRLGLALLVKQTR
jgi:DNA-binding NarL/FixJ family response regulator